MENETGKRFRKFSVVIPAYNEEKSLPILVKQLIQTFQNNHLEGEIIIVNDGSTDETKKLADELSQKYLQVRALHHKKRMGKTAVLFAGFEDASNDILVMIDADLQYSPEDLPKLLDYIEKGYDVVNGWRKKRRDSIFKKIPSLLYNLFSGITFGLDLHDHNSGLKAIKREVLKDINPKRGQHRFILNLAHFKGYKVGEVEIQHFPRKYGKTKYGSSRMILGFLDMISLRLQLALIKRPIIFFVVLGITLFLTGFLVSLSVIILNFYYGHTLNQYYNILIPAVLFMIGGILSFFFYFILDMITNPREE